MKSNQNFTQPASGCLKWAAAGILVAIALVILGNLPFIFNCTIVVLFGGVGVAIIAFGFYGIYKLITGKGGNHEQP